MLVNRNWWTCLTCTSLLTEGHACTQLYNKRNNPKNKLGTALGKQLFEHEYSDSLPDYFTMPAQESTYKHPICYPFNRLYNDDEDIESLS